MANDNWLAKRRESLAAATQEWPSWAQALKTAQREKDRSRYTSQTTVVSEKEKPVNPTAEEKPTESSD